MSTSFVHTIEEDHAGGRLDQVVAALHPEVHRSQLKQRLVEIRCNGKSAKLSTRVRAGDRLEGTILPPPPSTVEGEAIPLAIIHEATTYVVINKAQGMVVHPGAGNWSGTLVHALTGRYDDPLWNAPAAPEDPAPPGEPPRPGIVHRLDKETSGVMIVARTVENHAWLVEQFSSREASKEYLAVVKGTPRVRSALLSAPIGRDPHHRTRYAVLGEALLNGTKEPAVPPGSRSAVTAYRVLATYAAGAYALVSLHPHTGRTHQLRVHMHHLGHPILGDPLYARQDPRFPGARLMLHALRLEIRPTRDDPPTRFFAPPPERFREVLRSLVPDHPSR